MKTQHNPAPVSASPKNAKKLANEYTALVRQAVDIETEVNTKRNKAMAAITEKLQAKTDKLAELQERINAVEADIIAYGLEKKTNDPTIKSHPLSESVVLEWRKSRPSVGLMLGATDVTA
jgi:phage host-nuclease inhibitor protein Gam